MWKYLRLAALAAVPVVTVSVAVPSYAQSVCYQLIPFQNERYRLDIRFHSRLTTTIEEREFDHPLQFVYSVHGKHVGTCGFGSVRTVAGTLIGVRTDPPGGHRLGLVSHNSTGVPLFCKDVEVSCISTTGQFPPAQWTCFGQNKFGNEFQFDLVRVNPSTDRLCSVFEEGDEGEDLPEFGAIEEPSTGVGQGDAEEQ